MAKRGRPHKKLELKRRTSSGTWPTLVEIILNTGIHWKRRCAAARQLASEYPGTTRSKYYNTVLRAIFTLSEDSEHVPLGERTKIQLRYARLQAKYKRANAKYIAEWRKTHPRPSTRKQGELSDEARKALGLAPLPKPEPPKPKRTLVWARTQEQYWRWLRVGQEVVGRPQKKRHGNAKRKVLYNLKNTKFFVSIPDCGDEQFIDFVVAEGWAYWSHPQREEILAFGQQFVQKVNTEKKNDSCNSSTSGVSCGPDSGDGDRVCDRRILPGRFEENQGGSDERGDNPQERCEVGSSEDRKETVIENGALKLRECQTLASEK